MSTLSIKSNDNEQAAIMKAIIESDRILMDRGVAVNKQSGRYSVYFGKRRFEKLDDSDDENNEVFRHVFICRQDEEVSGEVNENATEIVFVDDFQKYIESSQETAPSSTTSSTTSSTAPSSSH